MAKTIKAVFGVGECAKVCPQWQYDYNTVLQFAGLDLPANYEVDLSNSKTGQSTTVLGDENGCVIPAQYFIPGSSIFAWVYLVGNNYGFTRAQVEIPIHPRAQHTGDPPTPEQQDALDAAIALLNEAVAQTGRDVIDTNNAKEAAQAAQQAAELAQQGAVLAKQDAQNAQQVAESARDLAQQYKNSAYNYARNAGFSADRALIDADRAEQAATNAGYLDVEIDENGHLIYTRTDAVDVDFSLDITGHLIMEAI